MMKYSKPGDEEMKEVMSVIGRPDGFTYLDCLVDRGEDGMDKSSKLFKSGRLIMTSTRANLLPGGGKGTTVLLRPDEIDGDPALKAVEQESLEEIQQSDFVMIQAPSYGRFLKQMREYSLSVGNPEIYEFFKKYQNQIVEIGGLK